jgi:hypothetical protein
MSDALAQFMFWGGVSVAAISYVLLQLERRRESLHRTDRLID